MKNHQEIVYEQEIGEELLLILKESNYSQLFFLLDSNTRRDCFSVLESRFDSLNIPYSIVEIEPGEASKSIEKCVRIWNLLSLANAGRDALIINLGGGVVCDLGGFIASTYKRGIDFIHYPTSLLAMVDAALGGKCGIDFMHFKNQIGSFRFPEKTIVNSKFLKTLPKEELLSAFAEMIKHALIADKTYWKELIAMDVYAIQDWDMIIKESIAIKLYLIEKDPFEKEDRKKLNFGHTIAHAIEKQMLQKGDAISHGIAVAAGILIETYLSAYHCQLDKNSFKSIEVFITKNYPKIELESSDIVDLLTAINQDKKNEKNANRFTLLDEIGKASINHNLQSKSIEEALTYYIDLY